MGSVLSEPMPFFVKCFVIAYCSELDGATVLSVPTNIASHTFLQLRLFLKKASVIMQIISQKILDNGEKRTSIEVETV